MEINPEQGSLHGDAVEISKPTMSNLAVSGVTNLPRFETFSPPTPSIASHRNFNIVEVVMDRLHHHAIAVHRAETGQISGGGV
jgi:hypothetical protein